MLPRGWGTRSDLVPTTTCRERAKFDSWRANWADWLPGWRPGKNARVGSNSESGAIGGSLMTSIVRAHRQRGDGPRGCTLAGIVLIIGVRSRREKAELAPNRVRNRQCSPDILTMPRRVPTLSHAVKGRSSYASLRPPARVSTAFPISPVTVISLQGRTLPC